MYNVTDPIPDCFQVETAYARKDSHRPIPARIDLVMSVTFPRTMSQTQSHLGLFRGGPGLCRWIQPQTNPSWDCSRHFCDIPTYNVTDPIPAGFEGTRLMPVGTATDQSQLGLLSSHL